MYTSVYPADFRNIQLIFHTCICLSEAGKSAGCCSRKQMSLVWCPWIYTYVYRKSGCCGLKESVREKEREKSFILNTKCLRQVSCSSSSSLYIYIGHLTNSDWSTDLCIHVQVYIFIVFPKLMHTYMYEYSCGGLWDKFFGESNRGNSLVLGEGRYGCIHTRICFHVETRKHPISCPSFQPHVATCRLPRLDSPKLEYLSQCVRACGFSRQFGMVHRHSDCISLCPSRQNEYRTDLSSFLRFIS